MTGRRVLVTGAAGFIGFHVCRELLADGWEVRGLDNCEPFYDPRLKRGRAAELSRLPGCAVLEGDVTHRGVLADALAGVSAVVHLAARPGVRQSLAAPEAYDAANVDGTAAVIAGCARAGVDRLVFASSSSVYGRGVPLPFRENASLGAPASPYAATKRRGEELVARAARDAGLRAAVLRLFSVYGPHQRPDLALHRFTAALSRREPIECLGDGRTTRDYTHVRDVARAVRGALAWTGPAEARCEVFNIGSGRQVRLDWLIAAVARAVGVAPEVRVRPVHPADLPATCADRTRAATVLGWVPREALDPGVAEFVAWYGDTHGHESRSAA